MSGGNGLKFLLWFYFYSPKIVNYSKCPLNIEGTTLSIVSKSTGLEWGQTIQIIQFNNFICHAYGTDPKNTLRSAVLLE